MVNKIDSNATGLRFAEEASLKVLPGSPVWYPLEPNSYNDFGGNLSTVARTPINASRQLLKGSVTDLDASGGFNTDLTQSNLTRLLQGFFFAHIREKYTNQPIKSTGTAFDVEAVASGAKYTATAGLDSFLPLHLIYASGFSSSANNGLAKVATASATELAVTGLTLVDETPPDGAKIQAVGYEFASATLDVVISGGLTRLNRASGAVDFTTLGLIPGEWVYVGGDAVGNTFANAPNNGFARIKSVAVTYIEFDKTETTWTAETGTGKTIRIFFGNVIKNEDQLADIITKSYQLERTLGQDDDGTMSEYLEGAIANQLTLTIPTANKVTADLSFVACDFTQRTGVVGVKAGDRPENTVADMFNTTNDVRRIKMNVLDATDPNPTALFGYVTDFSLTINNNVSPIKAIGVLGAFDISAGNFEVSGNVTAYFSDVAAIQSLKDSASVTVDMILSKNNAGVVVDIPLLTLGDGRLNIQQNEPVTLPLSINAAQNSNNYTMLFNEFPYLPTAAM